MRLTYYPGCSLNATAVQYGLSSVSVLAAMGIEVSELKDWSCCGASSGHSESEFLATALPLRNLILAERQGNDVLAPCAACYNLLKQTDQLIRKADPHGAEINKEMAAVLGQPYHATIQVRHVLEIFSLPEVKAKIASNLMRPLTGLKVASYYGCLLTRPPKEVSFENNPEQPITMDDVVRLLGAESVSWSHKTECCGASLSISRTDLVENLTDKIVTAAKRGGAQAIVTACPLCFSNLDTRQSTVPKLPIFFITELVGMAMKHVDTGKWLQKHIIPPEPLLRELNLLSAS